MTEQEIYKVIEAKINGKQIQRSKYSGPWEDYDGSVTEWNFLSCEYRVKPNEESHIRKYNTPGEVFEAIRLHGACGEHGPGYIKDGNTYRILKKFTVMENGDIVYAFSGWSSTSVRTWDEIHSRITWADGSPFGKLMED